MSVVLKEYIVIGWIESQAQRERFVDDTVKCRSQLRAIAKGEQVPSFKRTLEGLLTFNLTVNSVITDNQRVYLELDLEGCKGDNALPRLSQQAQHVLDNYSTVMLYRVVSCTPIGFKEIPYPVEVEHDKRQTKGY